MNLTFKITGVLALPQLAEHENVVARVDWAVAAQEGSLFSKGGGQTLLDTTEITDFVPADQLTEEQLIQWVIAAEGGQKFLDDLTAFHVALLKQRVLETEAVALELPFIDKSGATAKPQFSVLRPVEIA